MKPIVNLTEAQLAQTVAHIYAVHDAMHAADESTAFDFCELVSLDLHAQGDLSDGKLVALFVASLEVV